MKTWVHCFSSKFFARRPITILPRVWFAGAFQVSCAICKTFFGIYRACWHINQFLAGLHFLSKGMRIAIRSGSIQWWRRTICGVWVLANQKARLRSHAQQGGEYHMETNIQWEPVKTTRKRCFEVSKKFNEMRGVKRMMFYCHTKFQVETHYEMWAMKKTKSVLNSAE